MDVRASVKAVSADHPRHDQAGIVLATDGKRPPDDVTVRWDEDLVVEIVPVSVLIQLCEN